MTIKNQKKAHIKNERKFDMKNFNYNLLLASTAILSTTALLANASTVNVGTVNFIASADIVNPITVSSGDNISFGTLLSPSKGDTITVSSSGTISKTGDVTLLGGHNTGTFTLANSDSYPIFGDNFLYVTVPDIVLTNQYGAYCGYVSYFEVSKANSFGSGTCADDKTGESCIYMRGTYISLFGDDDYVGLDGVVPFGAKLTIDDYQTREDDSPTHTLSSVSTGHCTGNGTMTFILETQ